MLFYIYKGWHCSPSEVGLVKEWECRRRGQASKGAAPALIPEGQTGKH